MITHTGMHLKRTITEAISKFVPQKTLGGKQHVPWITTHIKRLIRRRQSRYNAAKKHNTNKNWKKYNEMRNLVRKIMNETHDNYVRQILNHYEDSKNSSLSKNFWKYIKSRKKDSHSMGNRHSKIYQESTLLTTKAKLRFSTNNMTASSLMKIQNRHHNLETPQYHLSTNSI